MSDHHSHEHHGHSSHEHIPQDKKILALSFAIITGFMIVEFVGGYWFNSLAFCPKNLIKNNETFSKNNPYSGIARMAVAVTSVVVSTNSNLQQSCDRHERTRSYGDTRRRWDILSLCYRGYA